MHRTCADLLTARFQAAERAYTLTFMGSLAAVLVLALAVLHVPWLPDGRAPRRPVSTSEIAPAPDYIQLLSGLSAGRLAGEPMPSEVREEAEETVAVEEAGGRGGMDLLQRGRARRRAAAPGMTAVRALGPDPVILPRRRSAVNGVLPAKVIELSALPGMDGSGETQHPPTLEVSSLRIYYPQEARDRGVEGMVILHFMVDREGRPSGVYVLQSLHPSCDAAAVRALLGARFTPGREAGEPVTAFTRLGIRFRLN